MFVRMGRDRGDRSNVDLDLKVLKVFHVDGMGTDFEELFILRVLLEVPRVRRTLDCRHKRGWDLKSASVEVGDNLTGWATLNTLHPPHVRARGCVKNIFERSEDCSINKVYMFHIRCPIQLILRACKRL